MPGYLGPMVRLSGYVLLCMLTACRAGHAVHESFREANNGLEQHTAGHDAAMMTACHQLAAAGCHEALPTADALRHGYHELAVLIDTMKVRLTACDPDDIDAADSIYALDGAGDRLHAGLLAHYDRARHVLAGDTAAALLERSARVTQDPAPPETWRSHYFYHVPAVALIAVLSKFRSDAADAEALCMQRLVRDCAARQR